MDFGAALHALKAGSTVTRSGWNGKGMWLGMQTPDAHSKMTLPYIFMRTADNQKVPWLASQTDMFSEDWKIHMESATLKAFFSILQTLERIEMNQQEMLERLTTLDTALAAVGTEVTKIGSETGSLLTEVQALKDALAAAGGTTPAVDAALAAVEARLAGIAASLQAVDDLVTDAPPAP